MRDHSFTIRTLHHFFCFHVGILTCMSSWGSAIWVLSAFRASNLMNFFIFLFVFLMMINSLLFICFSWNTASTTAEFIYRTSSKREDKKKKNQKKEKLKTKKYKSLVCYWSLVMSGACTSVLLIMTREDLFAYRFWVPVIPVEGLRRRLRERRGESTSFDLSPVLRNGAHKALAQREEVLHGSYCCLSHFWV